MPEYEPKMQPMLSNLEPWAKCYMRTGTSGRGFDELQRAMLDFGNLMEEYDFLKVHYKDALAFMSSVADEHLLGEQSRGVRIKGQDYYAYGIVPVCDHDWATITVLHGCPVNHCEKCDRLEKGKK